MCIERRIGERVLDNRRVFADEEYAEVKLDYGQACWMLEGSLAVVWIDIDNLHSQSTGLVLLCSCKNRHRWLYFWML